MTPSLFDAAAERAALASGRPLSQEMLDIVTPVPAALPADGLFAEEPSAYSALLARTDGVADTASIVSTLERFGEPVARYAARKGLRVHALAVGVLYMRSAVGCQVLQYPSGRWGFAGRVPVELAFVALDGGAPDPAEIEKRCHFGGSFGAVKGRSFANKDEALAALAEYEAAHD